MGSTWVKDAGEGAQFVADQPVLERAHPGGVEERLGHVLVHLAVPFGQERERALAQAIGRAFRRRVARVPQVRADERQDRAGREGDGVELRLDEAFARVDLARLHEPAPALDALGVAPVVAHVEGEGLVGDLVVGVAEDASLGVDDRGVRGIVHPALPAVLGQPARRRDAALALVARGAAGLGAHHLHRDPARSTSVQFWLGAMKASPAAMASSTLSRAHERERGRGRGVGWATAPSRRARRRGPAA
jgi:hypothetical protein